jgi:hypothetical protein
MSDRVAFDTGLRLLFQTMLGGIHTAFPGMVQSYDPLTMRAVVQPCLMRKYYDLPAATPLPVLMDVPVMFMSTGSLHIIAPPDPGSYVLMIVCERSLDMWLTSGGVVDPMSPRKFDLSDAVAIPGLFPLPSVAPIVPAPIAGNLEIRDSAGLKMMSITPLGIEFTGAVIFKNTVHACVVPGSMATIVDLATHMHPTAGTGAPSAPTPIPGP